MAEPTRDRRQGQALIAPLEEQALADVQDIIELSVAASGYAPTSLKIMARKPGILRAFAGLRDAVMRAPGEVPMETRWLAAHAVSASAGCRYCEAHTAANGAKSGLDPRKVQALPAYESSDLFTPAERAVVALGLAAGKTPNETEPHHFATLREHFSEEAIVELVAVLSLFGWLNRWNDTLSSDLEDAPLAFATEHLGERGWRPGKHAGSGD